jgi:hypothetical protein
MAPLPSNLPEIIADSEDIARFLTQSSHFNSSTVKPSAFLPSPTERETSVCRHGVEPLENLWRLGANAANTRHLHGAAIFKAQAVRDVGLVILPDEPPPHHAVIRGWPWLEDDPELQKAKQKEIALVMASQATLLLKD